MTSVVEILFISCCLSALLYFYSQRRSIPSLPNATPNLPLIGNALHFRHDPVSFLLAQQHLHGSNFMVNLGVTKIAFFLDPEGTNALLRGTEKSGVSLYAAVSHFLGESFQKSIKLTGGMEASQPIARQFLRDPETMTLWKETGGKLARGLIEKLSQTGQSVPLFQEISKLVMTVVLYALMGPAFTEKHGETIIPMVQAYEVAIQSPEIKAFPWWATKAGRLTKSVEQHFERLVDEEIKCRLAHPEKHRNSSDFLRIMLEKRDIYNKGFGILMLGLLSAGHASQTATFCWSLLHAIRSPFLSMLRKSKSRGLVEAIFRETSRLYSGLIVLRRTVSPQVICGCPIPKDTYVACSPLVTSRNPQLFPDPHTFNPLRWLTADGSLDEALLIKVVRAGESIQFGKGQHTCLGQKLGKAMVVDILWEIILGNESHDGYEVEIVSGLRDGVGVDNVGLEAAWVEQNAGTPFQRGESAMVKFTKRGKGKIPITSA